MFAFGPLFWLLVSIAGGVATGWSHAVFSRRQQTSSSAGELFSYIVVALVAVLLFKYFDGHGGVTPPAGKVA